MNKENLVKTITLIHDAIKSHDKVFSPLDIDSESPLRADFYKMAEIAVNSIPEDNEGWVAWYMWETSEGMRKVTIDNNTKVIENIPDLVDLILERKRFS